MPERKIVGTIMQGGKFYRAGDEDALAEVMGKLPGKHMQRLIDKGVVEGDWELGSPADNGDPPVENGVEAEPGEEGSEGAAAKKTARKAAAKKTARKK